MLGDVSRLDRFNCSLLVVSYDNFRLILFLFFFY